MLTEAKETVALELFNIGAIKFGKFRLKLHDQYPDAPLSPIYIDLRILRSFPSAMETTISLYDQLASGLRFDFYADVPTAATPIVAILSYKNKIPMISPRKEEKQHGMRRQIDGVFSKGQIVLLIDDLITRADSKLETISILEENGLIVRDVVVLIDREQGGVQQLKMRGYDCHVAFGLKELLQIYKRSEKITSNQYGETMAYLESSRT